MVPSLQIIGDWKKEIGVPLNVALAVGIDIVGTEGEKACRRALYWMAQSAQKLTRIAKPTRPVRDNPHFAHLLRKDQYKKAAMAGKDMRRFFRRTASKLQQPPKPPRELYGNRDEVIGKVGNRGLGVRSWQWGLAQMGGPRAGRKPIAGVTELYTLYGRNAGPRLAAGAESLAGYALVNRLSYVQRAMPPGWKADVERKAANRILGQARHVMMQRWRMEAGLPTRGRRLAKIGNEELARYFGAGGPRRTAA